MFLFYPMLLRNLHIIQSNCNKCNLIGWYVGSTPLHSDWMIWRLQSIKSTKWLLPYYLTIVNSLIHDYLFYRLYKYFLNYYHETGCHCTGNDEDGLLCPLDVISDSCNGQVKCSVLNDLSTVCDCTEYSTLIYACGNESSTNLKIVTILWCSATTIIIALKQDNFSNKMIN